MLFNSVKGQDKAKRLLARVLESERLGHAYLFAGPEGVGKVTMARLFSNILLCTAEANKPCLKCPGCSKFSSANHSDFVHIKPDGVSIKISQVRALKKSVAYAPFEGGYRVLLLEDVHTMRQEAGNSLLKLLEEPPAHNILILTGTSAETILPTIISRCQVVPFFPLMAEDAVSIILDKRPGMQPDHAAMLTVMADGSPGKALILETEGVFELYVQFVSLLVNEYPEQPMQVEQALAFATVISSLKESLATLLHLFRIFFKNVLMSTVVVKDGLDEGESLVKARELWNFDQLSAKIAAIDYAETALSRNCNRGLVCEVLMLNLFQRQV